MKLNLSKKNNGLEEKIIKFINKAKELIEVNEKLGLRFLRQANRLYKKEDYNFEITCKINEVCFAYGDKYPLGVNIK